MQAIDRAGTFRGQITNYALQEVKSGALAVQIDARIDETWVDGEWQDWREYECVAAGYIWIIKKDGTDNASQVRALVEHAGWDGNPVSIAGHTWQPTPCQFVVNEESPNEYHTEPRYRISWLNNYDQEPGGNVDIERAKALEAKYGSRFRAVAGDLRRNASPPTGRPPSPPSSDPPKGITPEEATRVAEEGKDGIPF